MQYSGQTIFLDDDGCHQFVISVLNIETLGIMVKIEKQENLQYILVSVIILR